MNTKLTLNLDALTVTTFETDTIESINDAGTTRGTGTAAGCCGTGCNTQLTCSSNLC